MRVLIWGPVISAEHYLEEEACLILRHDKAAGISVLPFVCNIGGQTSPTGPLHAQRQVSGSEDELIHVHQVCMSLPYLCLNLKVTAAQMWRPF